MKRIMMISSLFALSCTLATAQENDSIKNKDAQKCILFCDYEQQPSFPGGMHALLDYLKENIHWPGHEEDCIQGRVVVSFVVEKDGSITDAKVVRSLAPAFDAEALRVVASMPKWMPGRYNGEATRTRYCIPIRFRLDEPPSSQVDTPSTANHENAPAMTEPSLSSINEMRDADRQVIVYDLQGIKRYEGIREGILLPSGTYIVKAGKESKKIIIP